MVLAPISLLLPFLATTSWLPASWVLVLVEEDEVVLDLDVHKVQHAPCALAGGNFSNGAGVNPRQPSLLSSDW